MKCPYCLSEVEAEASVCKTCTRDIYLFKPLLDQIEQLQSQLSKQSSTEHLQIRITQLESLLQTAEDNQQSQRSGWGQLLTNLFQFLFIPLALLLIGHALISVVYDLPLIYLRVISIGLPLPFGFALFMTQKRSLIAWLIAVIVLAMASVLGMSAITSLIDQTPIWPQSSLEWKEFIEYGASISLSFLTGMLLGGIVFLKKHKNHGSSSSIKSLVQFFANKKISTELLHERIEKIESIGGSLVAIGTTAMSIYTGLKSFL